MNKSITADELHGMRGREGLILMGCGEPLDEWENGINDWLTEEGILLEGSRFTEISPFRYGGLTCLLFAMTDNVKLDAGKLAVWRLKTHDVFGGTWLSDFLVNQLGSVEDLSSDAPAQSANAKKTSIPKETEIKEGPEQG